MLLAVFVFFVFFFMVSLCQYGKFIIVVVGFFNCFECVSFDVVVYMQLVGYCIVVVNFMYVGQIIFGEYCYVSLQDVSVVLVRDGLCIFIVDCFCKLVDILLVVEEVIVIGVECVWMQLDIVYEEVVVCVCVVGLKVVMDKCIKIEYVMG